MPDDWHELRGGPVFLDSFAQGMENGDWRLFTDTHHGRAVLRSNLDVGLAWGLTWREDFEEPWTQNFSDKHATGHYADVLWRGYPVIREPYVHVDGALIPLPDQTFEEITPTRHALMPLTIKPWNHALGLLIHSLSGAIRPYEQGLSQARVGVEQDPEAADGAVDPL